MNLYITPHPPIILSEIGKGEEEKAEKTVLGMKKIASDIKRKKPKTIAIITPHGNVFSDALCINTEHIIKGNFGGFGYDEISYKFDGSDRAKAIFEELNRNGIACIDLNKKTASQYSISKGIDHGALVPLHFILQEYKGFDLVHINAGFLSKTQMYEAGEIIARVLGEENVLIASGDLSHRLTRGAPSGYDEMGKIYDEYIMNAVKNDRYIDILEVDENMLERAGQCAQKPLEILAGALEGYKTESEVYSYEGPFGVGYLTAGIVRKEKSKKSVIAEFLEHREEGFLKMKRKEDEYVSLARRTIDEYIKHGDIIEVPEGLSDELYTERKGVFVSIKKEGRLRGCIGTIEPLHESIAKEIIKNAISASTRDPRFNEIEENELSDLVISVDVLFPPEDIESMDMLDTEEYGVIVNKGYRRGLLLPNLEGIDSVDEQVSIALQKAGIREDENYELQRFKVVRHI